MVVPMRRRKEMLVLAEQAEAAAYIQILYFQKPAAVVGALAFLAKVQMERQAEQR
jgi:hypothetical protein